MIEELESKIHTEDFYDFNKDVETEFPIKDQQEISKILSINLDMTQNNKTFSKHEYETPTNMTLISQKDRLPELMIFNIGANKSKIKSTITNIIPEKGKIK